MYSWVVEGIIYAHIWNRLLASSQGPSDDAFFILPDCHNNGGQAGVFHGASGGGAGGGRGRD